MIARPRLLILSFSDISSDARVLRQVRTFVEEYEVTTCGFGDAPVPGVRHVRIPEGRAQLGARIRPYLDAALVRAHLYRAAYWTDPLIAGARRVLRGIRFDGVLANDIEAVPLALSLAADTKVHIDLHEFFPGLHDDVPAWNRVRKPYFEWLLRTYARRASSATTVGEGLAEAYRDRYGVPCRVVTNAGPRLDLRVSEVHRPIRLVHSGVAQPGRRLELMIDAVARSSNDLTLDLFLMPSDLLYFESIRKMASSSGGRVRVREPLPYAQLVKVLNEYDVGVFVLPPTTFNNANALPNKFFDFVQARLGMIIGPSAEMSRILREHDLGIVTRDFTVDAVIEAFDGLTGEEIARFKSNAEAAADALSARTQVDVWKEEIGALFHHDRDVTR